MNKTIATFLLVAAAATGQSLPTGEFMIDTSGIQMELWPTVAFDGTNFLVVWCDNRNGPDYDIYGARVSQGGSVLDPCGIAISKAWDNDLSPAVSFDGTNYLVVWPNGSGGRYNIFGVRVSQAGIVLDSNVIAISTASGDQGSPAACFGGTSFLVVWTDARNGVYDIYGARVNQAGSVLDPDGIAISTAPSYQNSSAVSFDGTNFLVVWAEGTPPPHGSPLIRGARVSQAGTVLDPTGIAIGARVSMQLNPAVTFGDPNFLVVWEDYHGQFNDVYGTFVNSGGGVHGGFYITTPTRWRANPDVSFDGTSFPVVWQDGTPGTYDIYGARVRADGTVYAEGPVVTEDGSQRFPMLACDSSGQTFLVYQGWAGTVGGKTYDTLRVWGKMDPLPGVEDCRGPTASDSRLTPAIVHGLLDLPVSLFAVRTSLLDIAGRRVMQLSPGANDVRHLSPGVYFIAPHPDPLPGAEREKPAIRKIVVTR